jgi:hypothetical protein
MFVSCSCDNKTKNLYLYILGFVISFAVILIMRVQDYFKEAFQLFSYVNSLSRILIIIPYFIEKKCIKYDDKKPPSKNTKYDYIIFILNIFINTLFVCFSKGYNCFYFSFQGTILLFLSIFMRFSSDFKFYKHRIVGILIFFIFSIIIDILSNSYEKTKVTFEFSQIIIQFIYFILYSVTLNYRKYLMEAKYVSPFMVCSIFGLLDFIFQIISELIGYNFKNFLSYNEKEITLSLLKDVEIANIPSILVKSIPFIILYIIFYCCYYLIIDKFTIIHGVIMEIITLFSNILIKRFVDLEAYRIVIFSILYCFIIIGLFIYIEIIELKFCGLNKYTRREILDREKKERKNISEENENSNRVSINSDFDLELDPIIDK